MTLRTRNLLIAALGLVLVAGVAYWFIANFHQVPFELRTPPSAAARRNRLLALEETLRTQGHTVFNRLRFSDDDFADPGNSAIVLDLDPRHLRASEVDHLLDFVARGALLLLRMPASAEGRAGPLLDKLGVEALASNPSCFDLTLANEQSYTLCGGTRLGGDIETRYTQLASYDDKTYGYWYGHTQYSDGRIFLVSELDMLHNKALDDADAVELSEALLAPLLARHRIHLFRGVDIEPFLVLIVRVGWPFLLPALAALLLWLWMRSQRFGPVLPDAAAPRRALLEHVRASGEFLFRRGQPVAMHRALLARVLKRISDREPAIAALPEDARVVALCERVRMPEAALRIALNPVGLGHADTFFSAISTLLQLERRL
ncbi:MAG: DUF4350 domain-containing protein [Rhodanobacteraceae bacterium]|nr:DUF4350 domain-containing protein [Rhodanobacteraceae bacterium]MBK7042921.1 DUF4350 domain-containing protein [Rhodanobacteraceae bacterium]MBP9153727.1 DUF4350 domain-containing protein [Xanthomonadales bacterium]HQW81779.1 DUF4350 domain-containing protein [Pseudomonadota bacterium]